MVIRASSQLYDGEDIGGGMGGGGGVSVGSGWREGTGLHLIPNIISPSRKHPS